MLLSLSARGADGWRGEVFGMDCLKGHESINQELLGTSPLNDMLAY